MRALTFHRPWPALILLHHPLAKRVENRRWYTEYRGPFAVHAGKTWDPDAEALARRIGLADAISWNPDDHPTGVVGVADLKGVVTHYAHTYCTCGPWAMSDEVHWLIGDNPSPLSDAIPCPGKQGWWPVPAAVLAAIVHHLEAVPRA